MNFEEVHTTRKVVVSINLFGNTPTILFDYGASYYFITIIFVSRNYVDFVILFAWWVIKTENCRIMNNDECRL